MVGTPSHSWGAEPDEPFDAHLRHERLDVRREDSGVYVVLFQQGVHDRVQARRRLDELENARGDFVEAVVVAGLRVQHDGLAAEVGRGKSRDGRDCGRAGKCRGAARRGGHERSQPRGARRIVNLDGEARPFDEDQAQRLAGVRKRSTGSGVLVDPSPRDRGGRAAGVSARSRTI